MGQTSNSVGISVIESLHGLCHRQLGIALGVVAVVDDNRVQRHIREVGAGRNPINDDQSRAQSKRG